VIAEYDGSGTLLRKYIYGPGVDEPICMIDVATESRYYYHYDGLGSVVALSNNSGTIVEAYRYDVFGTPTIYTDAGADGLWRTSDDTTVAASAIGNPYLFTGRDYESQTGLYYYRARFYNPAIGRFLQTDPIGYADGINWYAYCGNNPINFIDPWGLCGQKGFWSRLWRGAFYGDLEEDNGWTGVGSQVGVGLIPIVGQIADARDTWAAGRNLWNDPSWATAGQLAMAGVAWIPGFGDAAKGVYKSGRQLAKEGAQAVAKDVSGGRLGSAATRAHVADVANELVARGWQITGGGGVKAEEFLRSATGGRLGSNYVDITAVRNGRTLRINTIDTLSDGVTPTAREAAAAAAIRAKTPGDHLLLIPKPKQ
jgi:RHS repeat-associated protein